MQAEGALTATQAKAVLVELQAGGGDPDEIAAERGFRAMASDELAVAVDAVIAAEPDAWAKFVAGDPKPLGRLVGQVMQATGKRADGKAVKAALEARAGR
jgi:aspartyl-tRNA(Asn)/glutamyl-tRNA(Gln) amidotransferase subunit B